MDKRTLGVLLVGGAAFVVGVLVFRRFATPAAQVGPQSLDAATRAGLVWDSALQAWVPATPAGIGFFAGAG